MCGPFIAGSARAPFAPRSARRRRRSSVMPGKSGSVTSALEGALGPRAQAARVAELLVVRMPVHGHVVDGRADVLRAKRGQDGAAVDAQPLEIQEHREEVPRVAHVGRHRGHDQAGLARQLGSVAPRDLRPAREVLVEPGELGRARARTGDRSAGSCSRAPPSASTRRRARRARGTRSRGRGSGSGGAARPCRRSPWRSARPPPVVTCLTG